MAVIEIPPSDPSMGTIEGLVEKMNATMCPDNEKIRPETLDDVLEGLMVFRKTVIDLYNSDLERAKDTNLVKAKEEAITKLHDRLERDVSRAGSIPLTGPEDLKAIIREVKCYDALCKKFMGRAKFIEMCLKEKVPEDRAELIYISRVFDIETRRRLIAENINMLA